MGNSGAKHKARAQIHSADKAAESQKYAAEKRLQEKQATLAFEAKQKQYERENAIRLQQIKDESARKEREAKASMERTRQEHDKKMQKMKIDAQERDKNRRIQQKNANLIEIKAELNKLDALIETDSKMLEVEKKALEKASKEEQLMQEWINNFNSYKRVELDKVSDALQLKTAQEKFELIDKHIKTAIDKTGQVENNVGRLLNLTHHLLAATVSTTAHSNKLDAEISTFGDLIKRECQDKVSIEQFFKHKSLERFIPILAAEKFETLDSLKCNDDEEYDEILTLIENGVKQQNNTDEEEKKQINEEELAKKLLTDWGLIKYWESMEEEGWSDPIDWKDLTDKDFEELNFKGGNIRKFKRKLKDWLSDNKLLSLQEKRLLKEICRQPNTWEKYEKEQQAAVKEGLMEISPLLRRFFTRVHKGIQQSQEILKHDTILTDIQSKAIKDIYDMPPQLEYKDNEDIDDIKNDIKNNDENVPDEVSEMEQKANDDVMDTIRKEWKINSKCEIYSDTRKQWFSGEIIDIVEDNEGEWLNVQYSTNKIKQIGRFSKGIRPSINSDNKLALECHALTTASIVSINITNSMMEEFNKNVLTTRALTVATGIEDCCIQILKSQGTIRQSVILAQEILKMRPPYMSEEGKKLWTAVDDGIVRIFKSAINMVRVSSKYFGYFLRFKQSFSFYETNQDKSLMISLQYLHKDCSEFSDFQKDFSKTVQELSDEAMNCITNCVKTAIGAKTFEEYRNSRESTLKNWLNKKAIWDKKALELENELDQKQQERINKSADRVRLECKVKMLENNIQNNHQQKKSCIDVQSMLNKQVI